VISECDPRGPWNDSYQYCVAETRFEFRDYVTARDCFTRREDLSSNPTLIDFKNWKDSSATNGKWQVYPRTGHHIQRVLHRPGLIIAVSSLRRFRRLETFSELI